MAKKLKITLNRSLIGYAQVQKATVNALGLKKRHQSVVQEDNAVIRGMINRVSHLVLVEEVEAAQTTKEMKAVKNATTVGKNEKPKAKVVSKAKVKKAEAVQVEKAAKEVKPKAAEAVKEVKEETAKTVKTTKKVTKEVEEKEPKAAKTTKKVVEAATESSN